MQKACFAFCEPAISPESDTVGLKQTKITVLNQASEPKSMKLKNNNNNTNMNQDGLCFPVTLKSQETGQQLDLVKDCLDPKLKFPA